MRGRRWMNDQGLGVADIGEMAQERNIFNEFDPGVNAAFDAERQHRTRALGNRNARSVIIVITTPESPRVGTSSPAAICINA